MRLTAGGQTAAQKTRTRSDQFPIGETTHLPTGHTTQDFTITKSGTADAYHLVTIPLGARVTLDAMNKAAANLVIDAGEVLPNFSDGFAGKAPDLGAFEVGHPPVEFGRRAYLK